MKREMDPKIEAKSWNPSMEKEILVKPGSENIYDFTPVYEEKLFVIDTPHLILLGDLGIWALRRIMPK
jgi:hypothetical protein